MTHPLPLEYIKLTSLSSISQKEYIQRQHTFLEQCEPNSILVIRSGSETPRSRDTDYPFRQDSDFYYLTGFNEPDAWLILSNRTSNHGDVYRAMAVRPSDPEQEIWHGRRLGVEQAEQQFELDMCFANSEIDDGLLALLDGHEHLYWSLSHHVESDELIQSVISQLKASRAAHAPDRIIDWQPKLHAMRLIKSEAEIALMQKAADISCEAHKRAMTAAKSVGFEYQLAAEIHHTFAMHGAGAPAYNSIVGSGDNACILHYTENSDVLNNNEMLLIDAGGELAGYAADITRTFPINGVFTDEQKAIYQLVLDSQALAIKDIKPQNTLAHLNKITCDFLTEGLYNLGLLKGDLASLIEEKACKKYFIHGLGHWLGLDVHDVGDYQSNDKREQTRAFEPGMVMTIEPGLYIPLDDLSVEEKWRGIAVRIEDNILVTTTGYENLTVNAPKEVTEIETLMAKANS